MNTKFSNNYHKIFFSENLEKLKAYINKPTTVILSNLKSMLNNIVLKKKL